MTSIMSVGSVIQARKMRELREQDVRKLHNRIALLQAEEERALKKIEETKMKAHLMLENKLQQE
jgi:predicted lipoprotein